MGYFLPKAWSPGYAVPNYIRDEGLQRHAFTTQPAPSGTYDNPALENAAFRSGYVIPQYVLDDGYGGGASITKWAKRGTYYGPKIPDFLAKRANRILSKAPASRGGTALVVQSLGDVDPAAPSSGPLVQYGHDAAATIIAGVKTMPPKTRQSALKKILGKIDPTLYARANKNASVLVRQGFAPADALHNGLAAAMASGIHKELVQAGTKGSVRRGKGQLGLAGYEALGLAAGGAAGQSGARTNLGTGSSGHVYLAAGVPSQYPLMQVGPFQLPAYAVTKAASGAACAHEPCPNYDASAPTADAASNATDDEKAFLAAMQAAMPYYANGSSGNILQPAAPVPFDVTTSPAAVQTTDAAWAPSSPTPYAYIPGYHIAQINDMPSFLSGLNNLPATTPGTSWSEFGWDGTPGTDTGSLFAQNGDPNYWAAQGIFFTQDGAQYRSPPVANDIVQQRTNGLWPAVMYFNPSQITPDLAAIVGAGVVAAAGESGAAAGSSTVTVLAQPNGAAVTDAQTADYQAWLTALGIPTDGTAYAHAMIDTISDVPPINGASFNAGMRRRPFAKFMHPLWALAYMSQNPTATSIPSNNSAQGWGLYMYLETKTPWLPWSSSNPYVLRLYVGVEPTSFYDGLWSGLKSLGATIIQDVEAVVAAVGQVACSLVTTPGAGAAVSKTSGPVAGAGVSIASAACGGSQVPLVATNDPTVTILLIGGAALAAILLVKAVQKKKKKGQTPKGTP